LHPFLGQIRILPVQANDDDAPGFTDAGPPGTEHRLERPAEGPGEQHHERRRQGGEQNEKRGYDGEARARPRVGLRRLGMETEPRQPHKEASTGQAVDGFVAQISNLLYRKIAFCGASAKSRALERFDDLPSATRRYSGLQICATSELDESS